MGPHRSNATTPERGEGKINMHITPCQAARLGLGREKTNQGCAGFVLRALFPPACSFFGAFAMKNEPPGDAEPSDLQGALLRQELSACPDWGVWRRRGSREGWGEWSTSWQADWKQMLTVFTPRAAKRQRVPAKKSHLHPGFRARCLHLPLPSPHQPHFQVPEAAGAQSSRMGPSWMK